VLGAIASEKNDCNFPQRSDDNQTNPKTIPARATFQCRADRLRSGHVVANKLLRRTKATPKLCIERD
jgi:hypothetical protein